MIYEINHFGVICQDVEESVDFYTKAFGGKVTFEADIPGGAHIYYLQISDGMLELVGTKNSQLAFGYHHLAFMSDSIEEDYKKMIDAGYSVLTEPKPAGSGHGKIAFLGGPSGLRVELIERPSTFRIPAITEGDVRAFDHYSIAAHDLEETERFYTEHFGMQPTFRKDVDALGLTMVQLTKGNMTLELMHSPNARANDELFKHIALRVDDVDAFVSKLQGMGIQVEPSYPKDAVTGFGRTAKLSGPDGEKIDIVDRKYVTK